MINRTHSDMPAMSTPRVAVAFLLACILTVCQGIAVAPSSPRAQRLREVRRRDREVTAESRNLVSETDDGKHPKTLRFTLHAFEEQFDIHLERNDALFHQDYRETVYQADGSLADAPVSSVNCHYHGRVADADGWSAVAMTLCEGMRGHILVDGHRISLDAITLDPVGSNHDRDHVASARIHGDDEEPEVDVDHIIRARRDNGNRFSFVDNLAHIAGQNPAFASIARRRLNADYAVGKNAKMEMVVVSDLNRVNMYKAGARSTNSGPMRKTGKAKEELFAMNATTPSNDALSALQADNVMMFNVVHLIFMELSSPRLEVILRQQISFTTTEPDEIRNACTDGCLGEVNKWWMTYARENLIPHDAMHFMQGNPVSRYAGVAYMTSICRPRLSCSVTVDAAKDGNGIFYLGATWDDISTIAHEVGHQVGFPHDHEEDGNIAGLSCAQEKPWDDVPLMHYGSNWGNSDCIYDYNKTGDMNLTECWSPCSRAWYDYYMSRHRFWCLNYDNVCLNISGTMNCQAGGPPAPPSPPPSPPPPPPEVWIEQPENIAIVSCSTIAGAALLAGAGYIMYRRRKQGKKMIPLPPLPKWMKDWKWRRGAKVGVAQANATSPKPKKSTDPNTKRQTKSSGNKRPWKLKFKLPSMGPCLASCKSAAVVVKNAGVQKKKAKVKKNKVVPKRPPV